MFAVVFEVSPHAEQWDNYLGLAKLLRPELEAIAGFVDNVRYASLTRAGWLLSLSTWQNEKALVRWRVSATHHQVQERARSEVFVDYRLRVGQLTQDTRLPSGSALHEQRLDETESGDATTVSLVNARRPAELSASAPPEAVARYLGWEAWPELVSWDVFDAVLTPGELVLLLCWRQRSGAAAFEAAARLPADARLRHVRVIRDYGMFVRDEAPQFFPAPKR